MPTCAPIFRDNNYSAKHAIGNTWQGSFRKKKRTKSLSPRITFTEEVNQKKRMNKQMDKLTNTFRGIACLVQ